MASELSGIVENSSRIVFFGGAGVSTESGVPDFRSSGGLYSRDTGTSYAPEEVLSHSFFVNHTTEFYDYYRGHLLTRMRNRTRPTWLWLGWSRPANSRR